MLRYGGTAIEHKGTAFAVIQRQSDRYVYALHEKNSTTPFIFMLLL